MPIVSVTMPVFDGERYLAEAIDSILAQTMSDFEFLIVDDASQDGSVEIIRSYMQRDERIRLIQLQRNGGQANARNQALALAQGQFIAMMDCDDVSMPERLQKQLDLLRANPDVDVVGTGMQVTDEDLNPLFGHDVPGHHVHIILNLFFARPSLSGAAVLMKKGALNAVGGYDPASRSVDDTDLYARMAGKVRFANIPERLYLYRHHGANTSATREQWNLNKARSIRARWLERLLGDAAGAATDRVERLRNGEKFGWSERKLLRRDLESVVDAMVTTGTVAAEDRPILEADMNRRLEQTTPRLWQMFCHWRRHHFGR